MPWEEVSPVSLFKLLYSKLFFLNPDVVFTHSYSTVDARTAIYYALKNNKKLVIMSDSAHCDYKRRWFVELVKSFLIKGADSLLVSGPLHSHYYTVNLGFKLPIFWGYNAIDPSALHKNQLAVAQDDPIFDSLPSQPFLFCAARPLTKKNIPRLCAAWNKSRASSASYLVIAGGEQSDYKVSNPHNSIIFLGPLSPSQTLHIISKSCGCILPSLTEQFGNFVLEAIAFGKPILVSITIGSLHAAIMNNNYFLFNPHSLVSITEALDDWFAKHLGKNACPPADPLLPVTCHVRDFAAAVLQCAFSYQHSNRLDKTLSLITVMALNKIYERKSFIDINVDS
jgi:glycosyltransferase involved in cell wall biosynthesis